MAEPDLPFLDANVILRHALQDHAEHSPRASALVQRIEDGEQRVHTVDAAIFEADCFHISVIEVAGLT
ncbi:MAG: hypothetical protein AB7R89_15655 [Dehalococcoidia bacterium]